MIDIGELSRPATVLIEKISNAVGEIFEPYQIKRIARAAAEADLLQAETQIQITELHRRAFHRILQEEAQRQANIERITSNSIPLLNDDSAPENVADDWITNFFDKCRIVSDEDMQKLWARLLAGKANKPGDFSRLTVNLLANLDKRDAELFTTLCRFNWSICNTTVPIVFFAAARSIYDAQGLTRRSLTHLESLGLIKIHGLAGGSIGIRQQNVCVYYFDTPVQLTIPQGRKNALPLGNVTMTTSGNELALLCDAQPVPRFIPYVRKHWISRKSIISDRG